MFGFPLFEFLLLVLGFGFLIFVHELGHFLVAKWVGIRCPQFAIGFGHAICSWRKGVGLRIGSTEPEFRKRAAEQLKQDGVEPLGLEEPPKPKKGDDSPAAEPRRYYTDEQIFAATDKLGLSETEYRLNYLPLGGYVKMMGQEDIDPNAKSADPRAYNNKPIWARACVISAGVVMNIIFGALFLTAAFMMGVEFPSATVGYTAPEMPAATTYAQGHDGDLRYLGLRTGDVITAVNGKPPEDFKDVVIATALGSRSEAVELTVQRRGSVAGKTETLTYVLTPERQKDGERLLSVGFDAGPGVQVGYIQGQEGPVVDWITQRLEATPASERGGGNGIRFASANGVAIDSYSDLLGEFDRSNGYPVGVTLADPTEDGATLDIQLDADPTLVRYAEGPAHLLGLAPAGEITLVADESAAQDLGIQVGDIIVKLGDLDWPTATGEVAALLAETKSKPLEVVVLRDGEQVALGDITPRKGKLGIVLEVAYGTPVVRELADGSPADQALNAGDPFMPGTRISRINGEAVQDWRDIQRVLMAWSASENRSAELSVSYTVPVPGASEEVAVFAVSPDQADELLAAGWEPGYEDFFPLTEMVMLKADNVGEAFVIGVDKTKDFIQQTYITLLRLLQGNVKLYNLRGPVGIVHVGTTVAQQGPPYLLFFLGLISVNLAVINFLPIPIVDGGHMVFLAIEKIKGSPPSPQVQTAALYMGLAVIGFVFLATLFYDVTRLIGL